ncbi:MAG TPA: tol-pal system protein YbgF, partial [Thermoanaerobaculia bacterium]|nr:tol-pal system protein YbgF [Thermoanaerobaculia bacterium]
DVRSSYEAALALYDAGDLAAAEAAFRALVAHYPESELADNALFWIGAAQMKRGDDAAAEATMRALIEGYPAGNKVPDALFQLGVLRARAGDPEGARAAFETVLDHFPLTEAADRAAERLRSSSPSP